MYVVILHGRPCRAGPAPYGTRENALRLSPMTQDDRTRKTSRWNCPVRCASSGLRHGWRPVAARPHAPLPPYAEPPQPVRDLAAQRAGNTVHLTFSVPQKTTDKLPVRGPMTAKLCRSVDGWPLPAYGHGGHSRRAENLRHGRQPARRTHSGTGRVLSPISSPS